MAQYVLWLFLQQRCATLLLLQLEFREPRLKFTITAAPIWRQLTQLIQMCSIRTRDLIQNYTLRSPY